MSNTYYFSNTKMLPVDKFFENVLFDKEKGYYSSKLPFGIKGDFITSPGITNLFSEIIAIWLVSTWETLNKPKKFNIVELGPGDGSLAKVLIKTFELFPQFNNSVNLFLYEKSEILINIQKKKINSSKIKWIKNFSKIKSGPTIFFGNEFFDAIPVKQFSRKKKVLFEKYFSINKNNKITKIYKKADAKDVSLVNKYKSIKNLKFIEFPKLGFNELNKITKKIKDLTGGILLIDYGYLKPNNNNTLQSVINHKKNKILDNLGKADVTSLVNFQLLKEHYIKKKLKVKEINTQKIFLEKMGIIERADILSKKMSFKEQANLYTRLKRLLDKRLMGSLFKVIFAFKYKKNNFVGFE